MNKHLWIAFVIFILVAGLSLASNFIYWDETELEQSLYALPLGIGFLLELPFFHLLRFLVSEDAGAITYRLLWTVIPFLAGACYGGLYYLVAHQIEKRRAA